METREHFFECPYCGQRVSIVVDLSGAEQGYIEDCEVCCNPVSITFRVEGGEVVAFSASSIEQ